MPANSADRQDGPDAHDRIRRRQQDHIGLADGLGNSGAGLCFVGADEREAVRGNLRTVLYPPLLEVDGAPLPVGGVGDHHVGLAAFVAGG